MRFAPNPRDYDCEGDYEEAMNRYLDHQEYLEDQAVDDAWERYKEDKLMGERE